MKPGVRTGLCLALLGLAAVSAQAADFTTKRCINMGNALDAPVEGAWGHFITPQSLQAVAKAGFDTVRIPVRWSNHTSDSPDFTIDPRFMNRVSEVVIAALTQDLNVILNVHHFDGLNQDPRGNRAKFLALWQQIATHFREAPLNLYFELVNEPNDDFKGPILQDLYRTAFAQIRQTNPDRTIILGGENWSPLEALETIPEIDDPNQVYTFHYYSPFEFTHQKADWTPLKNSDTVSWGSKADQKSLSAAARLAQEFQSKFDVPILMGEFGAYEKAPYEDVIHYTDATRRAFEEAGIAWCAWNFAATFPFYDTVSKTWDERKLAALGLTPLGPNTADLKTATPEETKSLADRGKGQSIDWAYNYLRRLIGYEGTFMAAPYADQYQAYNNLRIRYTKDASVPGGMATEVRLKRKGRTPSDLGLAGKLPAGAKKGDVIVMAFWARTVKGAGIISGAGLQKAGPPYTPVGALASVTLTKEWDQYILTRVADRDYAKEEMGYAFQVAGAKQTLRFGPMFILNLGQDVDVSALP